MSKSYFKSTTSILVSVAMTVSPLAAQQNGNAQNDPEECVGFDDPAATLAALTLVDGEIVVDETMLEVDGENTLEVQTEFPCEHPDGKRIPNAEKYERELIKAAEDQLAEAVGDVTADAEEIATLETVEPEAPAGEDADAPLAELPQVEPTPEPEVELPEVEESPVEEDVVTAEVEETPATDDAVTAEAEETPAADDAATAEAEASEEEGGSLFEKLAAEIAARTEGGEGEEIPAEVNEPEAPAAAAAEDADATAEVETETVTEADVRSSDEDFDTKVESEASAADAQASASAGAETTATTGGSGNDGMSTFEKALLLGLGAAVVGSVLNNGDRVVTNSGDRVVVERDGELVVLKNDDELLRQPGSQIQTQTFADGSTRTVVTREDGTQIVTIRNAEGRVLRRARVLEDGTQVVLFDDTQEVQPVEVTDLPEPQELTTRALSSEATADALRELLLASQNVETRRSYSLRQIREISQVRALAPEIELANVTFATGSAAIEPSQAEELANLGLAVREIISEDPGQVFLIEGHTDAVGDASYNLALSDRRAETVAKALSEYFGVPPENLITQGYGETQLKIATQTSERANRRASLRNITPLLR